MRSKMSSCWAFLSQGVMFCWPTTKIMSKVLKFLSDSLSWWFEFDSYMKSDRSVKDLIKYYI